MLETLAIVAYKQPVTRLDIEDIRSKDCTYAVQTLMNLGLIQVVGRKETIGKPLLFGTTDDFLKRFSISEISDLPDYETLFRSGQYAANGGGKADVRQGCVAFGGRRSGDGADGGNRSRGARARLFARRGRTEGRVETFKAVKIS